MIKRSRQGTELNLSHEHPTQRYRSTFRLWKGFKVEIEINSSPHSASGVMAGSFIGGIAGGLTSSVVGAALMLTATGEVVAVSATLAAFTPEIISRLIWTRKTNLSAELPTDRADVLFAREALSPEERRQLITPKDHEYKMKLGHPLGGEINMQTQAPEGAPADRAMTSLLLLIGASLRSAAVLGISYWAQAPIELACALTLLTFLLALILPIIKIRKIPHQR
ncbi:hypothetical protein ACIBF1_44345 [Spirillospora sp. NPDC050679]